MDKTEVKAIVNDEIKKFVGDSFDKEIKRVLHNTNSATRDEVIQTIKNALDSLVKVLWQKKEFWKTDIR